MLLYTGRFPGFLLRERFVIDCGGVQPMLVISAGRGRPIGFRNQGVTGVTIGKPNPCLDQVA